MSSDEEWYGDGSASVSDLVASSCQRCTLHLL
jgi:hypothetical protein